MSDTYKKRGKDFSINLRLADEKVAVIAIHGGRIELGTTEIAEAIAAEDLSFYSFIGKKPRDNYKYLHITSTKFNEPNCLNLLQSCSTAVSIHGVKGNKKSFIMVGGLNSELVQKVIDSFKKAGSEFKTRDPTSKLKGLSKENICNRCKSGGGVQLEISRKLRDELKGNKSLMTRFAKAVIGVL